MATKETTKDTPAPAAKDAKEDKTPPEKVATEKKNGDTKKSKVEETPAGTTITQARDEGKKTDETVKTEPVETLRIETDGSGSFVEFSIEMTLNLGNMEFAKIHVGRRAGHKAGEPEADAAIKTVKAWTRREFRDEVAAVRAKKKEQAAKEKEAKKKKEETRKDKKSD